MKSERLRAILLFCIGVIQFGASQIPKNLSLGFHFSPTYSFNTSIQSRPLADHGVPTFKSGVIASWPIKQKISIQLEANYLRTAYKEFRFNRSDIRRTFNYLEIPVQLYFKPRLSEKYNFLIKLGTSGLFLIEYNQKSFFEGKKTLLEDHINHPEEFRTRWNWTYIIGIGLEYKLTDKRVLFIEPFFQSMLLLMEKCDFSGCDIVLPKNAWLGVQCGIKI